jgi:glutamate/tyrosine decarboxylase-like PLP-dependent enzyme
MPDTLLSRTLTLAERFLSTVNDRPVAPLTSRHLTVAFDHPLQDEPLDPARVIEELAAGAEPGLVASQGPRYFGFVTGASLPAALAADWLTSVWDQNAGLYVMSPAASAIEQVAAGWLLDLLRLPPAASVGFVTGATAANVTALAAARHEVLRRAGWDVEADGLQGAPRITVLAGAEAHSSIRSATRILGLGASTIVPVAADDQGRMRPDDLQRVAGAADTPLIICAQAGNVNTGAFDPLEPIADVAAATGAWLHVDGAFGMWAAASRALRPLVAGAARADSWAVDGHKWLNVPYDAGFAIVRQPAPHRAAMSQAASYLMRAPDEQRDGMDWTPEASRRARGFTVYAAIRSLGRKGLEDLLEGSASHARRMAARLAAAPGVEVLNDVVLNQVLVRFQDRAGSNVTPRVTAEIQAGGVCWAGGTMWRGEPALRISVSGWRTAEADIDLAADDILRSHRAAAGGPVEP